MPMGHEQSHSSKRSGDSQALSCCHMHCFLHMGPTGPSSPCVISNPSCPAKGCVCRQVRSRCRTWWLCWLVMRTKCCCLVSSSRWSAEGVPCSKASRCCHRSRLFPQVFVTARGSIVHAQHPHALLRCACVSLMSTLPACAAVAFGSVVCFSLPWNLSSCRHVWVVHTGGAAEMERPGWTS